MSTLSALIRPRKRARHAKPSKGAPLLAAGGVAVALSVADGALLSASASAGGSQAQFEALAQCESGGNWSINTGNGYYGGLQFALATWRGIGESGYPHEASKATQIAAGQRLQERSGWGQWPACSRKLGLSGNGGVSSTATHTHAAPAPAPVRTHTHPAPAPVRTHTHPAPAAPARTHTHPVPAAPAGTAPAWGGHIMTIAHVSEFEAITRAWQQRMRDRGWEIAVDGLFGPQSTSVAERFAAEKGLRPAISGSLDRQVFNAAWTAPVT